VAHSAPMSKAIARRLRSIPDLTSFAAEAKVSRRTLFNVKAGTHKPTAKTVGKILAALAARKGGK
jgi:DNA-binding phage protein